MAQYAIYSYEIQEGDRSLFYEETGTKTIDMANEIVSNLLNGRHLSLFESVLKLYLVK